MNKILATISKEFDTYKIITDPGIYNKDLFLLLAAACFPNIPPSQYENVFDLIERVDKQDEKEKT